MTTLEKYTDPTRVSDGRVRAIEISSYFFQPSKHHRDELDVALRSIFALLPNDAAIVPMCGNLTLQAISDGCYRDARVIFIHSEQFNVVPENAVIPKMEFTFTREGVERLKRWYWRLYFRLANRFVRRWPLAIEY